MKFISTDYYTSGASVLKSQGGVIFGKLISSLGIHSIENPSPYDIMIDGLLELNRLLDLKLYPPQITLRNIHLVPDWIFGKLTTNSIWFTLLLVQGNVRRLQLQMLYYQVTSF
jgi:hypothetical protein